MSDETEFERATRILGPSVDAAVDAERVLAPCPGDASDSQIHRLWEGGPVLPTEIPTTVLIEVDRDIALALFADGLASRGHTIEFGPKGRLHVRENHIGKHNREEWERRFRQRAQRIGDYADKARNAVDEPRAGMLARAERQVLADARMIYAASEQRELRDAIEAWDPDWREHYGTIESAEANYLRAFEEVKP